MRYLLILLALYSGLTIAADVYKTVDENGNVIFSDKPSSDAERIHIKEIQTIDSGGVPESTESAPEGESAATDEFGGYYKLQILEPKNDSSFQENSGSLNVSVEVEPAFSPDLGHKLVLNMDGKPVTTSSTTQMSVSNVDRGTHTIFVTAVDESGKELIQSDSVTFTMHRYSKLQNNSAPTPNNAPKPPTSTHP